MSAQIQLPWNWKPRPYQKALWDYLSAGGKRAVAVWPRRAGKDETCLHHTATAAFERVGNYVHMLPIYQQARKAIWDSVNAETGKRRIDEVFPKEIRSFTRENEMMIGLGNGSTWQVVGSDTYDSLMGTSYVGMVMSEYALSNPSAWGYFSPILLANGGWAIFISTPRGKNHLLSMLKLAQKDEEWFAEVLTNDNTQVFTPKQMKQELMRLQSLHGDDFGRSIFLQEYFSSFDAAILGSIWGDCITKAKQAGRITAVKFDAAVPVNTSWDLGHTDSTSVWFWQAVHGEVHVIDFMEHDGKSIEFYAGILRSKAKENEWTYATHYLPHDARARTLAAGGKSIQQQLLAHGVGRIVIAPRLDVEDGIQAARATFPHCWFDEEKCAKGLEHLSNYKREYDEEKNMFQNKPVHDASSHAADAFRVLSLVWKHPKANEPSTTLHAKLMKSNVRNQNFGELKRGHFRKMRDSREGVLH